MKICGLISSLVVLLVLFSSLPDFASDIPLERIIANVQEMYQRTKDIEADFFQESTIKSLNKTQIAKGKFYFKTPSKLRWDYNDPTKQEIVTDGNTLWMYIADDRQVTVNAFSSVYRSNTSAFFLSGMGDLDRDFDVQLEKPSVHDEEKAFLLRLTPKEQQANIDKLFLLVDRGTFLVLETYFNDFYGNLIRIRFKNMVINQGLPDSMFTFTIPEGVDVVEPPQMFQDQ